ncbi:smoothelin-like protein 1 [Odocoileus virginianus]|uniref:Smoothelin-like protein 1 n=1 Tax=Odocoileus virginianus TaxID=9874 RepID=A0A6J0XEL4_ODOVR
MEQKAGKPTEDGATVPPAAEAPETAGGGGSAEEAAAGLAEEAAAGLVEKAAAGPTESAARAGQQEWAPAEDGAPAECQADGLGEVKAESQGEAGLQQEDRGQGETTAAPGKTDRRDQTHSEPAGAEREGETASASEKPRADEKEARPGSRESVDASGEAQAELKQASAAQEAEAGGREAEGKGEAAEAPQEEGGKAEEPRAAAQEEAGAPAAQLGSPKKAAGAEEATPEPQEEEVTEGVVSEEAGRREGEGAPRRPRVPPRAPGPLYSSGKVPEPGWEAGGRGSRTLAPGCLPDLSEALAEPRAGTSSPSAFLQEPGGPADEQEEGAGAEAEDGAGGPPSSPEGWPESPTEEGGSASPEGLSPDTAASEEPGPSASGDSSPSDVPQSPTEAPPPEEKKKEKAPERRVSAPTRPRGPRAQNRKAIVDKFGGAASGPTALFRNTKAAGAAVGGVRNMLLEWCRAMTRSYEHVDIQNFSSSWGSGMAFCALIHKFFPDAFDYAALDPAQRRHNFTLAFSTAEKLADCAQLLEVDDMVRLAVPDSKCVYTYIQELYRSLVQKGLVKTKKK